MRIGSWKPYCILLLLSLFLSHQHVSSQVEKKATNVSSLGPKNNPPVPVPASTSSKGKEETHNASGIIDSCLNSQEREGGGKTEQMSVETGGQSAKAGGADVNRAPASIPGLYHEEQHSRNSGPVGNGYVPERYIVGCGGDRAEAARR